MFILRKVMFKGTRTVLRSCKVESLNGRSTGCGQCSQLSGGNVLKKLERCLLVNLLGPGPRLIKKNYRAAVSQRLRNNVLNYTTSHPSCRKIYQK